MNINLVVVVDLVAIPGLATAVNDPSKFIWICDISDNVKEKIRWILLFLYPKLLINWLIYQFQNLIKNLEFHQSFYQKVM
jgi:hypothetical protein